MESADGCRQANVMQEVFRKHPEASDLHPASDLHWPQICCTYAVKWHQEVFREASRLPTCIRLPGGFPEAGSNGRCSVSFLLCPSCVPTALPSQKHRREAQLRCEHTKKEYGHLCVSWCVSWRLVQVQPWAACASFFWLASAAMGSLCCKRRIPG